MPKQSFNINFAEGLDEKSDPKQIPFGRFSKLENSVFTKAGLLTKRNGFAALPSLPNGASTYLTTFASNLTAIGTSLEAFSEGSQTWISKGSYQPINLSVSQLARSAVNQTQCDSIIASNGNICTVYTEVNNGTAAYNYVVQDSTTGQNISGPTLIPGGSGVVTGSPRVFLLGAYYIIVFTNVISAVSHLQYIAVSSINPSTVTVAADIVAAYISATTLSWDGFVVGQNLYIAYNSTSGGQNISITYLSSSLVVATPTSFINASAIATIMSVTADQHNIYATFWDATGSTGHAVAVDQSLSKTMSLTSWLASGSIANVATTAANGVLTIVYENVSAYSYDSNIGSNFLSKNTITAPATLTTGTLGSPSNILKSVGLASKGYLFNSKMYVLSTYDGKTAAASYIFTVSSANAAAGTTYTNNGATFTVVSTIASGTTLVAKGNGVPAASGTLTKSGSGTGDATITFSAVTAVPGAAFQPTYFLIDILGNIIAKLAYQNGGGYLATGLPTAQVIGTNVNISYLYKDLITSVNKTQGLANAAGVYSQTGVNLATFDYSSDALSTSEIGNNLNLSGGYLYAYDGQTLAEQNFHLYPDSIEISWSTTGGSIHAQPDGSTNANAYFYQCLYQWTDAKGNIFNSAPSIPIAVTTTGTGSTGSNTITGPYLRLTGKSNVKIILYRWSIAQPLYYQVTSITAPLLNSTTSDSWSYVDTLADSSILGNGLIYTNGGVVEDVGGPACTATTLFDTRLWLIDAEDQNLLWYSKQVIEGTPVEMSDLFTFYVAPNAGATASTGPMRCLAPMDDKLIIFKKDAIYYINGSGPDNTGANDQYSQPIFITSTVGSVNQNSIVLMQNGLMFQSDKGTWLLGRDLSTNYIGAPVENSNTSTVTSALNIPATTQIRMSLDSAGVNHYDYFFGQWSQFSNVPAVSSTIYQDVQAYISPQGGAFEETPGAYTDNGNPVLQSFATGWINIAALQGFERFYWFYLLGQYFSPHKLQVLVSYNYVDSPLHQSILDPQNFSSATASPFGDQPSPFGSPVDLEQWKIHAKIQKCQSFKIQVNELFDPSLGVPPGQGLTLSGLNIVASVKKGTRPIKAANTAG